MKRYMIVLMLVLSLVGCVHGDSIDRVQPGMSVDEVKAIMGPPDEYRKIGDYEVYSYYKKIGPAWHRLDYHYIVKDNQMIEYGAGQIRHNRKTGDVFIMPLK